MRKFRHKEVGNMFSDKLLEKIFAAKEIQRVPFEYQSTVIHVVERVLDEMGVDLDDAVYEPES
jgi:hypothetical protein